MQVGVQAMTDEMDGIFEFPHEDCSAEELLSAEDSDRSCEKQALRVVVPKDFEPAEAVSAEEKGAYLNRFSALFVNEGSARRGGIGTVYFASNPFGEHLALKVLNCDEPWEEADIRSDTLRKRAELLFREEFECHRKVSGLRGFPKLFGYCHVGQKPALVMEWVEGISLKDAQAILSVSNSGAISPLAAGRIGRDLFEAVARLSAVDSPVVHRDLSPSNVIIRTSRVSFQEQVDEGSFDVCLIDFGSASVPHGSQTSFTENNAFVRKATPDYAPPEMLVDPSTADDQLQRKSSAVDVYAAGSILFELASGQVPFDLEAALADGKPFCQAKREQTVRTVLLPHATSESFLRALAHEPELAVSLELEGFDLNDPDQNLVESIDFVDRQLIDLALSCLKPEQEDRPSAEEMQGALRSFCRHYYRNIVLSCKGEPLIPCMVDGEPQPDADLVIEIRDSIRSVSKSLSLAVLAVVLVSVGLLTAGTPVSFDLAGFSWQGSLSGFDVSLLQAFPAVLGFALAGKRGSLSSFIRGTVGVLAGLSASAACISGIQGATPDFQLALYAALVAASFAAWCPLVADFALTAILPLARRMKRRGLPGKEHEKRLLGSTEKSLPDSLL